MKMHEIIFLGILDKVCHQILFGQLFDLAKRGCKSECTDTWNAESNEVSLNIIHAKW